MAFLRDVRVALRSLRQRPALVAALVGTLALGVGVNTTIYSFIDSILLHPLAVADPDRLLAVSRASATASGTRALTYEVYEQLAAQTSVLSDVAAGSSIHVDEVSLILVPNDSLRQAEEFRRLRFDGLRALRRAVRRGVAR